MKIIRVENCKECGWCTPNLTTTISISGVCRHPKKGWRIVIPDINSMEGDCPLEDAKEADDEQG